MKQASNWCLRIVGFGNEATEENEMKEKPGRRRGELRASALEILSSPPLFLFCSVPLFLLKSSKGRSQEGSHNGITGRVGYPGCIGNMHMW